MISAKNKNIKLKFRMPFFYQCINTQLIKARKAFFKYKSLFYSKHINQRVKILLYQSLVRPIITYGCPIWFNISPSYMEKIRKFERKCLRSCTLLYRTPNSDFMKYVSNRILYNTAQIIRIDNFIIQLVRNHIIKCFECDENNLIMAPYHINSEYIRKTLMSGFIPPEAFIYLDSKGLIQNDTGIPIFYHVYRRATNKAVDGNLLSTDLRFDTTISSRDIHERSVLDITKFWWICQ